MLSQGVHYFIIFAKGCDENFHSKHKTHDVILVVFSEIS